MINCSISKNQQLKFAGEYVAPLLKKMIDSGETLDVKKHMTDVYNKVLEASQNNQARALDYARLIPLYIDAFASSKIEVKRALREQNFDWNSFNDIIISVSDSEKGLENTRTELNLKKLDSRSNMEDANDEEDLDEEEEVDPEPEEPTPPAVAETTARRIIRRVIEFMDKAWHAYAPTVLSTAGVEAPFGQDNPNRNIPYTDDRKLRYRIQRNILHELKNQQGANMDSSKMDFFGFGGVYLTAMSIKQIEDRVGNDYNFDLDKDRNNVLLVVTNENGELYEFNDMGIPTTESGTIAYYPLRSTKHLFTETGKFKGEKAFNAQDKNRINSTSTVAGISKKEATKNYISEMNQVNDIVTHVLKNKDQNTAQLIINGGSQGYIEKDFTKYRTKLSDTKESFDDIFVAESYHLSLGLGLKSGTTYFTAENTHGEPLELERPTIGKNLSTGNHEFRDADFFLDLIFGDIIDSVSNSPISYTERKNYINNFLNQNRQRITIAAYKEDETPGLLGHKIIVRNKLYPTNTPEELAEAKEAARKYLTELNAIRQIDRSQLGNKVPIQQKEDDPKGYLVGAKAGDVVQFAKSNTLWVIEQAKVGINIDKVKEGPAAEIDIPILTKQEDGSFILTTEKKNYREFLIENFYSSADINLKEGKFNKLNSYFTFEMSDEEQKRLNPDAAKERDEVPSVDEEVTPSNNIPSSELDNNQDDSDFNEEQSQQDGLDVLEGGLDKLKTVKEKERAATKQQIAEAKVWYENLKWKDPQTGRDVYMKDIFPYKRAFRAINTADESSVANWSMSGITLFKGADYSDLYHEAWHGFSQAFMSIKEKKELYNEIGNKTGSFTTHTGKRVKFSDATPLEKEEWLAEEFRNYMLNGQKETPNEPKKNNLFKRILNFLKLLFNEGTSEYSIATNEKADKKIKELYDNLRVGSGLYEYNFSAKNVMFGALQSGVLSVEDRTDTTNYINNEDTQVLMETIDSLFTIYIDSLNSGLTLPEQNKLADLTARFANYKKLPAKERAELDQEKEEFVKLKSKRNYKATSQIVTNDKLRMLAYKNVYGNLKKIRKDYTAKYEAETSTVKKESIARDLELLNFAIREFGKRDENNNLLDIKDQLPKAGEPIRGVIAQHMFQSKLFSDAEFLDLDGPSEDDAFLKGREGYVRSGTENSLKELAKTEILFLLKGVHATNEDGSTKINRLGVPMLADFQATWNRTARALQNSYNINDMYNRLVQESKTWPSGEQLLKRLGPLYDENQSKSERDLWTNFWQAFNKTRIPLIQLTVTRDTKGDGINYSSTMGEAFNADYAIGRRWENEFRATLPGDSKFIEVDDSGPYLNIQAVLTAFPESTIEQNAFDFYKAIGFNFTDNEEIRTAIKNNPGRYGSTYFRKELANLLTRKNRRGIVPKIRSLNQITEQLSNRYKALQILEARYSDTVSNFMVTNAEGNSQYEHTLNNTLTMMVNAINNADTYMDLISMPHMSYLDVREFLPDGTANPNYNPFAEASIWLKTMFNLNVPQTNKLYGQRKPNGSGDLVTLKLSQLSGALLKEKDESQKQGTSSASADEFSKLILDLHLAHAGYPELMRHADKGTSYSIVIDGGNLGNGSKKHYVPGYLFTDKNKNLYEKQTYLAILPHLIAEMKRMRITRNLDPQEYDFTYLEKGQSLTMFDDILMPKTKKGIDKIVNGTEDISQAIDKNKELSQAIYKDIVDYFEDQYQNVKKLYKNADFATPTIINQVISEAKKEGGVTLNASDAKDSLIRSYVHNNWIHNVESLAVIYGDLALYNHAKEEFHKRNAGAGSTGNIYRTDVAFQKFANSKLANTSYAAKHMERLGLTIEDLATFNGTFATAVVKDQNIKSAYFNSYVKSLGSEAAADAYKSMTEADAQGLITLDAYRELKNSEGDWSDDQERLFQKIVNTPEQVTAKDVKEFFPVIKAQYWGPLKHGSTLNIMAFHKYSLFPLIPSVIKNKNAEALHDKMLKEGIKYITFESGSKVGTISKRDGADLLYKEDRTLNLDNKYTKNVIHLEFLKNQLAIAPKSKGKVIFSTQLRKLIEDGLMEGGVPTDFMPNETDINKRINAWNKIEDKEAESPRYKLLRRYEKNIEKLTQFQKEKLLKEMNWTSEIVKGKEVLKGEIKDLMRFIKKSLTSQDLADHELDFIDVDEKTGRPKYDLSLSLSVEQIEKALNALMVKRLINQKVNGEGLIQVASTLFEEMNGAEGYNYTNPTEQDLKEHGSNDLPTYDEGDIIDFNDKYKKQNKDELQDALDKLNARVGNVAYYSESRRKAYQIEVSYLEAKIAGKKPKITTVQNPTKSMKVKVALQGQFKNLLNITHPDGERIGTIKRLNKLIKDDAWLDMPGKRHREMITMVGVRIPVQGLNSMEFMEVYEFLPEEAGSVIIPPTEIVAKSGADYDVDKMTVMMPNIRKAVRKEGAIVQEPAMWNYNKKELDEAYEFYVEQKKRIERSGMDLRTAQAVDDFLSGFDGLFGSSEEMEEELLEMLIEEGKVESKEEFAKRMLNDKAIQNDLIKDIVDILSLPSNYETLIRPNGTEIVDVIAADLADKVMDFDPLDVRTGERRFIMKDGKKKEIISPTRALEIQYNLYKHSSNAIGKDTLGLGAVDNTYNTLFNRIGMYMNPTAGITTKEYNRIRAKEAAGEKLTTKESKDVKTYYRQKLFLPHNKRMVGDEEAISLSHIYDINKEHKISDVINQLMNGWVDIAKDAWIFNIQGNKEVSPTLLFMIQSGVPVKDAIYLASNPLVRNYVKEQKLAKSTFAQPLKKAPTNPMLYRVQAKEEMLTNPKYGFGFDPSTMRSDNGFSLVKKEIRKAALLMINDTVLNDKGHFDQQQLYNSIVNEANARKKGEDYEYTYFDKAAFLHFLEIEDMAMPVRDIKMKMNVDTAKDGNLFEAQDRIKMIEELRKDQRIPMKAVDRLITDSPIGSFFIQPFQIELLGNVFPLRNHSEINEYLRNFASDFDNSELMKNLSGDQEKFVVDFKNSLPLYLFQNAIRGVRLNDLTSYNGYSIKKGTIKNVPNLKYGAYVQDDVLYIDPTTINNDFANRNFAGRLGLASVSNQAFNKVEEYYKFILERETLRAQYSPTSLANNSEFKALLSKTDATYKQKDKETAEQFKERKVKAAYEQWLRDTALDNSFNYWKMFRSKNTYADKFFRITKQHKDLKSQFSILSNLSIQSMEGAGFTNISLNDSKLDSDQINVAYENLKDLSNPKELQARFPNKTAAEIEEITDLFKKLPYVAFLQSGFNTRSNFSLVRIVDQKPIMRVMEKSVKGLIKHMEKRAYVRKTKKISIEDQGPSVILSDFMNVFIPATRSRAAQIRGRDMFSGIQIDSKGNYKTKLDTVVELISYNETKKVGDGVLVTRKFKNKEVKIPYKIIGIQTDTDGNKQFKAVKITDEFNLLMPIALEKEYVAGRGENNSFEVYTKSVSGEELKTLVEQNPDKIIVYNEAPNATRPGTAMDDSRLHRMAANTFGIPSRASYSNAAGKEKSSILRDKDGQIDPDVKTAIDESIAQLKEDATGKVIVWNKQGYGQDMIEKGRDGNMYAPKTFLYLSEQLLENFGYINPSLTDYKSGRDAVQKEQPVSDIKIVEQSDQTVRDFINNCIG